MLELHSVRKIGLGGGALVAVDQDRWLVYLFRKDTGLFHVDRSMTNDFFLPDPMDGPSFEFEKVSVEQAVELMRGAKPMNRRNESQRKLADGYFEQIRSKPEHVMTPAEVGLSNEDIALRPTKAKGLPDLLRARAASGKWTGVYLYRTVAAQSSTVREGLRGLRENKTMAAAAAEGQELQMDPVDLPAGAGTLVRVRLARVQVPVRRGERLGLRVGDDLTREPLSHVLRFDGESRKRAVGKVIFNARAAGGFSRAVSYRRIHSVKAS